jgi:hypothetical protein
MDPDALLDRLFTAVGNWNLHRSSDWGDEMAECIESLDEWISRGGFLPTAWSQQREEN